MQEIIINYSQTGENIKKLMRNKALTCEAVAEDLGLQSDAAVKAWRAGRYGISLLHALQLADLLGVTVDEIIVLEENK